MQSHPDRLELLHLKGAVQPKTENSLSARPEALERHDAATFSSTSEGTETQTESTASGGSLERPRRASGDGTNSVEPRWGDASDSFRGSRNVLWEKKRHRSPPVRRGLSVPVPSEELARRRPCSAELNIMFGLDEKWQHLKKTTKTERHAAKI